MTAAHEVVHEANHIVARPTPAAFFANKPSHLTSLKNRDEYEELYKLSVTNPDKFFDTQAGLLLSWDKPYEFVHSGDFKTDSNVWFFKGQLNASYNCLDKHAFTTPNKVALIYEADDEADNQTITYGQLLAEVCKVAAVLKSWGVQKGDRVAIYLPMIPAAVVAMLAVARLGAVHTVIFAGFSAGSVKDRVADAGCKVVITCNQGKRGGKLVHTKKIVDEGLLETGDLVQKVLVLQRTTNEVPFKEGRDFWWHEEIDKYPSYLPHTPVNSEDPLFMLYTSGSTGAPKGVVHSTAGYLLGAALSTKYVFDVHKEDILFTAGDVGWITGHTYAVYGPLVLGATSVIFESTPVYPDIGRYWRIIQRHKATHFYVAPTALRLIKQKGEAEIEKYDISSLRTLGSVGEPIAPELWHWYDEKIGHGKCHIADTYWQTESGAHLIAPMAGVPTKPGSASLPFFGIQPAIIDPVTGKELEGNDVAGVLAIKSPWPSMARTVYKNHRKYVETYLKPYPGYFFTGDSAGRDNDGYYWIRGRVDDVVNVSGHRLSTAEIEAALIDHTGVTEGAVVGIPDELTGQAIVAFVTMKEGLLSEEDADFKEKELALRTELRVKIRSEIGPFAAPKTVIVVKDLPKTRSGKIVRRILRKIISQEADQIGDTSTLVNPHSVKDIIASTASQYLAAKI